MSATNCSAASSGCARSSDKQVARRGRAGNAAILAFCWSHWRRRFYEVAKAGSAPIAEEALRRIAELYKIEAQIRGRSAAERRAVRQAESKPLVADLKAWLRFDASSAQGTSCAPSTAGPSAPSKPTA